MSASSTQPAASQGAQAIRVLLEEHADYILHKFGRDRPADIRPDFLSTILGDLRELEATLPRSDRTAIAHIRDVRNLCYAAQSLYGEPQNRSYYFEHLRSIAYTLKQV